MRPEQLPSIQSTTPQAVLDKETPIILPLSPEKAAKLNTIRDDILSRTKSPARIDLINRLFDAKIEGKMIPGNELLPRYKSIDPESSDDLRDEDKKRRGLVSTIRRVFAPYDLFIFNEDIDGRSFYYLLTLEEKEEKLEFQKRCHTTNDLVLACNENRPFPLGPSSFTQVLHSLIKDDPNLKALCRNELSLTDDRKRWFIPNDVFPEIVEIINYMLDHQNKQSDDDLEPDETVEEDGPAIKPPPSPKNPFNVDFNPRLPPKPRPQNESPFKTPEQAIAVNSTLIVLSALSQNDIDNLPPLEELFDQALHSNEHYTQFTLSDILNNISSNRLKRFFKNTFPEILEESSNPTVNTNTKASQQEQDIINMYQSLKHSYDIKAIIQKVFSRYDIPIPNQYL